MKRHINIISILSLIAGVFSQSLAQDLSLSHLNHIPRVLKFDDSGRNQRVSALPFSFNYTWDPTVSAWQLNDTSEYIYDTQGNVIEEIRRTAQGLERIQNQYDATGRKLLEVLSDYNPFMGWEVNYLIEYTYGANNKLSQMIEIQYANNVPVDTVYGEKFVFILNPLSQLKTHEYRFVLGTSGWDTTSRFEHYYNPNNQLIESKEFQNTQIWQLVGSIRYGWKNSIVDTVTVALTYGSQILQDVLRYVNISYHQWNGLYENSKPSKYTTLLDMGQGLFVTSNSTYIYDANGGFIQTDSALDYSTLPFSWILSSRFTYEIDPQLNFRGEKFELWNNNTWEINSHDEYQYQYTVLNQVDEIIHRVYDNGIYEPIWRKDYEAGLALGISDGAYLSNEPLMYPNPLSDGPLKILWDEANDQAFKVSVLNATGKLIYSGFHKSDEPIALEKEKLVSGIYFIRLEHRDKQKALKLIVE